MKRIFAVLVCAAVSTTALAGEVIELRGDMVLNRCEKNDSDHSMICSTPITNGKPIRMELQPQGASGGGGGEYKFNTESDGYSFEGTIYVTRFQVGTQPVYSFSVSAVSIKGNDLNTLAFDSMGNIQVKDVDLLNQISFYGNAIEIGNVSVAPIILIGSKNADLTVLNSANPKPIH